MQFAVVDVETSGLSPRRHRVLQVAVVVVDGDRIVDQWESKIKLRWPFQRLGPRRVHGLRRADLRGAPPMAEVMAEVAERVNGRVLVAHNLDFDQQFLQRAADRVGVELDPSESVCTLLLSRRLDPDRQLSHSLADLAERYGATNDKPHDALEDARTTAAVLPQLLEAAGVTDDAAISALSADQSAYLLNKR